MDVEIESLKYRQTGSTASFDFFMRMKMSIMVQSPSMICLEKHPEESGEMTVSHESLQARREMTGEV